MPDDNLNYTELETQLQTAPLTWLPGLLYTLVATCVRRRVYQEGGLVIAVMRAQQIAEAEDGESRVRDVQKTGTGS